MKKILRKLLITISILAAVTVLFLVTRSAPRQIAEIEVEERREAYLLLLEDLPEQTNDYIEYVRTFSQDQHQENPTIVVQDSPVVLQADGGAFGITINITQSGFYSPIFQYRRKDNGLSNTTFSLILDGRIPFTEAASLELKRSWSDETKVFGRDRYNNETLPLQIPEKGWIESPVYDAAGRITDPVGVFLTAGTHRFELRNPTGYALEIGNIILKSCGYRPVYDEYIDSVPQYNGLERSTSISVNAIDYAAKNAYDVRMGSRDEPSAFPFHPVDRLLNVIDGTSWEKSGEEILYNIDASAAGLYTLTLHYNNPDSDFSTFRGIRINGEIPFAEVEAYEFPATKGTGWKIHTLGDEDGNHYRFYLQEGSNILSLRAEKEPVSEAARALKMIIGHMNFFGIEIMKVTGRDIDPNRTWRLTDYIKKSPDYLNAYRILLTDIINDLSRYSTKGIDSAVTASLHTALFKIEKLSEDPDELPIYLQDIYSTSIYDRPITQILGDTITMLEDCELSLDMIYLDAEPVKRRDGSSVFSKLYSSLRSLISTFTSDKYVTRNSDDVLNIWATRPITHTDLMQKMTDADFSARTGLEVKISVMPDPNRLILATAADNTPDIAMGLPSHIPFDLAIRGAALNLSEFDDFWSIASGFSPGAFMPFIMNEDVYAMPETLDFHTLVYRKDIFRQLEIDPPDTWDDVINILPELQRYGMNFYHPIAGGLPTLKWFYQTSPFVYQFGGTLYADDGLSVSLDEPKTVQGLRYLSELFSLYALQQQVPAFYNSFRFGVIPVGIVDSLTYLQLKYAAPELKGQWALAPYPGIPDENGDPQRWFIANGVGAVIMKDTNRPDQSWDYLKWWLSTEAQVDFGYRLQSTYGPEYLWISANLDALEDAPIDSIDKDIILEQVRWQRDVPRTPAQYMLERGLSDIWINSATANKSLRTEIDKMIPVIDREVTRKMTEFGFLGNDGTVLKPFVVPRIDWVYKKFAEYRNSKGGGAK